MKKTKKIVGCLIICLLLAACKSDNDTLVSEAVENEHTMITEMSTYICSETITELQSSALITSQLEKELVSFQAPIIEHISKKYPLDFLSEDQVSLFDEAAYIYANFFEIPNRRCFTCANEDFIMGLSGIDYESFKEYLLSVFSEEFTEILLSERFSDRFKNKNGELYVNISDRGSEILFQDIEFLLEERTDNLIQFIGNAEYYYSDDDIKEVPENEKTIITFEYRFIRTDDGWRVDEFHYWQ